MTRLSGLADVIRAGVIPADMTRTAVTVSTREVDG